MRRTAASGKLGVERRRLRRQRAFLLHLRIAPANSTPVFSCSYKLRSPHPAQSRVGIFLPSLPPPTVNCPLSTAWPTCPSLSPGKQTTYFPLDIPYLCSTIRLLLGDSFFPALLTILWRLALQSFSSPAPRPLPSSKAPLTPFLATLPRNLP